MQAAISSIHGNKKLALVRGISGLQIQIQWDTKAKAVRAHISVHYIKERRWWDNIIEQTTFGTRDNLHSQVQGWCYHLKLLYFWRNFTSI